MTTPTAALAALLPHDLAIGDPDVSGALTVFPLLAASGELEYRSFAEAAAHGFAVKELEHASVNDLIAHNPLDVAVLLYEGEEVVGAQQDRTFDVTVLVGAQSVVKVPVSCVEAGRWDGSRHDERFSPSDRSAFPALRAAKNRHARAAMAAGSEVRADQQAVWAEVADKGRRVDAGSATGAMGGIYDGHRERLASLQSGIRRRDGQVGAVACIAGRPVVVDLVSRSDVFASLHGPLVRGYCLDALEHPDGAPAPEALAEAFLELVRTSPARRRPTVGVGDAVAFTRPGVGGSALAVGETLVQLTAFAEDHDPRGARILRPSRRR